MSGPVVLGTAGSWDPVGGWSTNLASLSHPGAVAPGIRKFGRVENDEHEITTCNTFQYIYIYIVPTSSSEV